MDGRPVAARGAAPCRGEDRALMVLKILGVWGIVLVLIVLVVIFSWPKK